MSFGNFGGNTSATTEQELESSRILYAGAICAIAALPLLLTVGLMVLWGA
jgi:hypothetical protein